MTRFTQRLRLRVPGIRWQLTLWYAASVMLILLLAAGSFALAFRLILNAQVDNQLQTQARQLAANVAVINGQPHLSATADTLEAISPWARILDRQGHIIFTTPSLHGVLLKPASVQAPLAGGVWEDTVRLETYHLVRFYAQPLYAQNSHSVVVGVIQVGQPLDLVTETAGLSALVLALLLPIFLAACLGGSYWLSGLAFAPVRRLIRMANTVQESGDLHQRALVPQAQDEVRALAETLNAMLGRLDTAFTAQRRFIADASHDLRTPVAVMLSLAENARDGIGERTPTQALSDIADQAQRLRQLIANLLQLSRADEGSLQSEREPVRLDLLARDVAISLLPLAQERQIILRPGSLEAVTIQGDIAQLLLILTNLVDNALTYTPSQGSITISVTRLAKQAVVIVTDTGMGITPEDLPHIFERFYRADLARQRATGGSGLGLAIVQALVDAHHGSIAVTSAPGQGATFTLLFPALSSAQA